MLDKYTIYQLCLDKDKDMKYIYSKVNNTEYVDTFFIELCALNDDINNLISSHNKHNISYICKKFLDKYIVTCKKTDTHITCKDMSCYQTKIQNIVKENYLFYTCNFNNGNSNCHYLDNKQIINDTDIYACNKKQSGGHNNIYKYKYLKYKTKYNNLNN